MRASPTSPCPLVRRAMSARWRACLVLPLTLQAFLILAIAGCDRGDPAEGRRRMAALTPSTLRPVRVLLAGRVSHARVRSQDTPLMVTTLDGRSLGELPAGDWHELAVSDGRLVLIGREPFGSDHELRLVPRDSGAFEIGYAGRDARRFLGGLVVLEHEGGMDVINEVDVEPYVASVIAHELPGRFDAESFKAGAIVARSFVIDQMRRRNRSAWDVRSTQQAQVYGGVRDDEAGLAGLRAARLTRGLVCTYSEGGRERLFPTYYSSVCGGVSQSAAIFGQSDDVPPLAGGVVCDDCRIAPRSYREWGPVSVTKSEIARRLFSSGDGDEGPPEVREVVIAERTYGDRALRMAVTLESGEVRSYAAERFRQAIGPGRIRSTMFEVVDTGDSIEFTRGRGFGHGLGLCQWGMEGQARRGVPAGAILKFYYPGMHLTRVY